MTVTPHLGFIVAAYGLAAITILAMIVAIVLDSRALGRTRADAVEGGET